VRNEGEVEGGIGEDGTPALWLSTNETTSTICYSKLENRSDSNHAADVTYNVQLYKISDLRLHKAKHKLTFFFLFSTYVISN